MFQIKDPSYIYILKHYPSNSSVFFLVYVYALMSISWINLRLNLNLLLMLNFMLLFED